ncbi:MAG: hypothetical protein M3515_04980 [Actinomycetota bacterium]|nr:hypothetical protein [Actinomycetota bacterium]
MVRPRPHEHERSRRRSSDRHRGHGPHPVAGIAHGLELPVGELLRGGPGHEREAALDALTQGAGRLDGREREAQQALGVAQLTHGRPALPRAA